MEIDIETAEKSVKAQLLAVIQKSSTDIKNGVEGVRRINHVKDITPVLDTGDINRALDAAINLLIDHAAIANAEKAKADEKAATEKARADKQKADREKDAADVAARRAALDKAIRERRGK